MNKKQKNTELNIIRFNMVQKYLKNPLILFQILKVKQNRRRKQENCGLSYSEIVMITNIFHSSQDNLYARLFKDVIRKVKSSRFACTINLLPRSFLLNLVQPIEVKYLIVSRPAGNYLFFSLL